MGLNEIKTHRFFTGIDWEKVAKKEIRVPFKQKMVDGKFCFHLLTE